VTDLLCRLADVFIGTTENILSVIVTTHEVWIGSRFYWILTNRNNYLQSYG
jgi:hypothetical protein